MIEGEASHGVEQEGEIPRRGHEGVEGVQGGDEVLPEVLGVADDAAVLEDGMAAVVRVGAEPVAEASAGAGEDGGGEEGGFSALEGGGGDGAGTLVETLSFAEHGPAASRVALDVPGAGGVGFPGGVRLVALGEEGKVFRREDVDRQQEASLRLMFSRIGRSLIVATEGFHASQSTEVGEQSGP